LTVAAAAIAHGLYDAANLLPWPTAFLTAGASLFLFYWATVVVGRKMPDVVQLQREEGPWLLGKMIAIRGFAFAFIALTIGSLASIMFVTPANSDAGDHVNAVTSPTNSRDWYDIGYNYGKEDQGGSSLVDDNNLVAMGYVQDSIRQDQFTQCRQGYNDGFYGRPHR
jgi:hypothetical protein